MWYLMAKKTLFINVSEEKHHELKVWCASHNTDLTKLTKEAIDFFISSKEAEVNGLGRKTEEAD